MNASAEGHVEIVKMLLQKGANLNLKSQVVHYRYYLFVYQYTCDSSNPKVPYIMY